MRRLWVIVPVLALAAACTSSDGGSKSSDPPSPTDPVSTSTSATPTSTPPTTPGTAAPTVPADVPTTGPNTKPGEKPPVMPLAATKHTPAGAKAFAEFFIKTIDWAYATTSTTYMRHYFVPGCVECGSIADAVDRARTKMRRFIGDRFTIRQIVNAAGESGATCFTARFDVTSVEVVDSKDQFVDGMPALHNFKERVCASWIGTTWTITKVAPLQ